MLLGAVEEGDNVGLDDTPQIAEGARLHSVSKQVCSRHRRERRLCRWGLRFMVICLYKILDCLVNFAWK